jgi:hypothetical protein
VRTATTPGLITGLVRTVAYTSAPAWLRPCTGLPVPVPSSKSRLSGAGKGKRKFLSPSEDEDEGLCLDGPFEDDIEPALGLSVKELKALSPEEYGHVRESLLNGLHSIENDRKVTAMLREFDG